MDPAGNIPVPIVTPKRHWFLIGALAFLLLVTVGVLGCLTVSRDTAALRDGMLATSRTNWNKTVELRIGPIILGLARFALGFVDLPEEARTALRAARGAEVSLYSSVSKERPDPATALALADRAMTGRDWMRLVACVDHENVVAVYVPNEIRSPRNVNICVAVVSEGHLVVVGARADLEPLLELARSACSADRSAAHRISAHPFRVLTAHR